MEERLEESLEGFGMSRISEVLQNYGIGEFWSAQLAMLILGVIAIIFAIIANAITKRIILNVVTKYVKGNNFKWDNYLVDRKVLHRIANIVPALIIYGFATQFGNFQGYIQTVVYVYIFLIGILAVDGLLNVVNDIYTSYEVSKEKPIKGYLQVVKIFIYIVGAIVVIANLMGESPIVLLSGIGALSAVLMLVFKDSLLGLVAGIQISANDMVRIGDWIDMPKYGASGDVLDISLNTVKVKNFDGTITTIPTYALMSDSFTNWRGMIESGGRRIMRAVYLDVTSIRFCDESMIEKFKKIDYIKEYIEQKIPEIESYNKENNFDVSINTNGRRLTNIGVFRAYIQKYIENHPKLNKDMIMMSRQLQSGAYGVPIEVYAFTDDINWVNYENIQSDIFDHILAVVEEFELKLFQNPTGADFKGVVHHEKD